MMPANGGPDDLTTLWKRNKGRRVAADARDRTGASRHQDGPPGRPAQGHRRRRPRAEVAWRQSQPLTVRGPDRRGRWQEPMLGLYLHIPFCQAICSYCNFNRGLFDGPLKARYVAALDAGDSRRRATAGRPTRSFSAAARRRCSNRPRWPRSFAPAAKPTYRPADAEITLETNPETRDARAAGRVSRRRRQPHQLRRAVVRDGELARLGRIHSAERAEEAIARTRAAPASTTSASI